MALDFNAFLLHYDKLAERMIGDTFVNTVGDTVDTVQTKALKAVMEQFSSYSLDNVQLGQILAEMTMQTVGTFNKDAITGAISFMQQETTELTAVDQRLVQQAEAALKAQQKLLTIRQEKGFSDNMFIKDVEFQGNLASFAVNSGSLTAQTAIDTLHTKMSAMIARAT